MQRTVATLTPELRKQLERSLRGQLDQLEPYRVPPYHTLCVKGGFEMDVAVFARQGTAVFFVSLDALRFGVGVLNELGDIVESDHYPNVTMATRSFIGAVKGRA